MAMMRQAGIGMILTAGIAMVVGCAASYSTTQPTYRTISAPPLRDTDAAMKANQAGLEHLDTGEWDAAARSFEQALSADVEFGPAHNNLGKVYFARKSWYKAAWEFEYARKLLPRNAEPNNNLGLVYETSGRLDEAVEHYREAVRLDGGNPEYRGNLARAMTRRGDRTAELRSLLSELVQRDARPEWQAWARRQLGELGRTLPEPVEKMTDIH